MLFGLSCNKLWIVFLFFFLLSLFTNQSVVTRVGDTAQFIGFSNLYFTMIVIFNILPSQLHPLNHRQIRQMKLRSKQHHSSQIKHVLAEIKWPCLVYLILIRMINYASQLQGCILKLHIQAAMLSSFVNVHLTLKDP